MNALTHQSQVLVALLVLLTIHTAVSLGAYRWLTKTTILDEPGEQPPVDVTTPEQQARGEKSFKVILGTRVVSRFVPGPVVYYVWAGYAGLGIAALMWVASWARHGHVR